MEEEFPDNDRRKRTKFGRASGQWRFAERTPSPEKERETPPLEIASPSRLPAQDRPKEEENQSLIQQAHGIGSSLGALDVATNALTDRSELKVRSEDDPNAKNISLEEGEESSTSLSQVTGGRHMIHEATTDETTGNSIVITPRTSYTKIDLNKVEILQERGEVDRGISRPTSSTSRTVYLDDEDFQEPAQTAQVSPSAPDELLSSSAIENHQESGKDSDQESDDPSHQESASLFDEQSESGQSNAALYSGPTSDFGLDGSTFSRPPPAAETAAPPSAVGRLRKGLESDILNTFDAEAIPSPLQSDGEETGSEAEEPSIPSYSAAQSLLSDEEVSGEDTDVLEGHDAAQRRSSAELPNSDQLGSPEAGELDDEAMNDLAAAQLLTDDRTSWKHVEDEKPVQRSSSNPPSSNQFESQETQEEFELRSRVISDNEAALELITGKGLADFPMEQSPSSSREEEDQSDGSEEEDTLETSPEKGPADSGLRSESPIGGQEEMVLDVGLSREDSNIYPSQGQEFKNRAGAVEVLTSKVQKTLVEIIDLESGDEDDTNSQVSSQEASRTPGDRNDSEFAKTIEVSAHNTTLPSISDARDGSKEDRPPTLRDSTGSVFKRAVAVEEFPPADVYIETEFHEETFELEEHASRKQSPVARSKKHEAELPFVEAAPFRKLPEAKFQGKDFKLLAEKVARVEQSRVAETEPKPILMDELPSTVPDSFEDIKLKGQLLTPSSTQRTKYESQTSSVSVHSTLEDDSLPTPRLTQSTSAEILPPVPIAPPEQPTLKETPAPPKKTSALIEKLKEMRRISNQSPKSRSSDASVLDPWFAPKRLSQVVPDSEDDNETESSPEREAPTGIPAVVGRQLPQTPEKPLAKSFIRSPQRNHVSSIQSSPQYLPPSQTPPPGFRTNLSYFVPLATLASHVVTNVDILAIALSSTPVTRATSGPRDYNQTLYITDPSSTASPHSITTAQIFRPNTRCFPLVDKGDALLLRDFKVQPFQRRPSLLSTESSAWAVFRKGSDVQIRGPPVEFGAEERGFARGLWDWWASLGDDTRIRFENAVPKHKKPNITALITNSKAGGDKGDVRIKKEEIKGLGVDLPGSQTKRRESIKDRSLGLDGVEEGDMVHESVEAPKRVLRARGAKGANGRSESARESRFGTVFTGGLGEPDETQGSAHELRDGKAYRDKRR